jgi:hypothetical protein
MKQANRQTNKPQYMQAWLHTNSKTIQHANRVGRKQPSKETIKPSNKSTLKHTNEQTANRVYWVAKLGNKPGCPQTEKQYNVNTRKH